MRRKAEDPAFFLGSLLLLLGLLVYWNSLNGAFFFDDYSSIHENVQVRSLWPWSNPRAARPEIALAGRPVPLFITALNFAVSGLDPFAYHFTNLLIHLLNGLLLFGVLRRSLLRWRHFPASRFGVAHFAFAASALWLVHPLVTESVNYVIQRTELLMAFGLLGMLYCLLRWLEGRKRAWLLLGWLACCLGMASKESMVVAPVLVLLFDRTFVASSWKEIHDQRRAWYAALAASWLILALLLRGNPRMVTAGFHAYGITPWEYFLTQSKVILHYFRLVFWPAGLVLDYGDWVFTTRWQRVWMHLAALGLAVAWVGIQLRRHSAAGFLGIWVLLILAPTSSFLPIPTEVAAERRMYLPVAAFVVGVLLLGWRLLKRLRLSALWRQRLAAVGCALLLLSASIASVRRNEDYRSELVMLEDILRKRPRDARAHYNLGILLGETEDLRGAELHFRIATRLTPGDGAAHNNLGVILERTGRKDEAWKEYMQAVTQGCDAVQTYTNVGAILLDKGRKEEAIKFLKLALTRKPDYGRARRLLAQALAKPAGSTDGSPP